jgi:dethiobiotin synthetase
LSLTFIAGTGTDIGKTFVTKTLAQKFFPEAQIAKPVLTGIGPEDDCHVLARETGREVQNCYSYVPPMAPWTAATLAHNPIERKNLENKFEAWRKQEHFLVEGVGAASVPMDQNFFLVDLLTPEDCLILVVGLRLGSIGETLATLAFLGQRSRRPSGIIFNSLPGVDDLITSSSFREIEAHLPPENECPRCSLEDLPVDFFPRIRSRSCVI